MARLCWLAMALLWLVPLPSSGADRVIVRGNYYREASTRVLQPTVDVEVDVPDERLTLGTTYVLDAISSASIASGAAQVTGGDAVFTEIRHEVTGRASSRLGNWATGGFFRYSTETDYISRSIGAFGARDLLQRSLTLSLSYAYNFDRVYRIQNNTGVRAPWCGGAVDIARCQSTGTGIGSNLRQVHYVSAGYTHAWLKTLLGLASVELTRATGPLDNPYRGAQIPTSNVEIHPLARTSVALMGAARWILPKARVVLEPRYRFTTDSWLIHTHAIDPRVHLRVLDHLRLRARYRYYRQSASFICNESPQDDLDSGGQFFCTTAAGDFATADPKMGAFHSHTPGVQLVYELDGLSRVRGLGWLEGGWIEATYNHVFQSNRYGNARLGALAFSLAF
ncbi:MAG: DUF3570 domain-containing protein [Myxococcales bacterium]|nr:DUF3570 domain-containing protein [Myxococcales bacterium]MCB9713787.1 DUF3570 domain-containing protein [Myxococcales bacterium]